MHKSEVINFRRKKRKIDGIDVSIPCDVTNVEVKKDIGKKIQSGIYNAGEIIVPQKFRKLVFDGTTAKLKEYEVGGRKIPLHEIRMNQYEKRKIFHRLFRGAEIDSLTRSDIVKELDRLDEHLKLDTEILRKKFLKLNTSRYLQFWYDGSCISNHSHFADGG